ncbi:hypothetical protein HRbin29_01483 [bacterium HR29]|nr:hypothetical protein HRbin29_01483 [bacterium HR29]
MSRIDGLQPGGLERTLGGRSVSETSGVTGEGRAAPSRADGADRAVLSLRGRLLAAAMESVRAAPEVRSERVAALKAAIAEGRYDIDAESIARRLLADGLGELAG